MKYDPNGNELWMRTYDIAPSSYCSEHEVAAGTIDSAGNIYITGYGGNYPSYDYVTVKYDTNGNLLWALRYDYNNLNDKPAAIIVSSSGHVYVAGTSGDDYATIKYDSNGNQLWGARYSSSDNSNDYAVGLAVDSHDSAYVTGYSYTGGDISTADYVTVKYDSNGNELWIRRYNGPKNNADQVASITVDASDNIYVTGTSGYIGWGDTDYITVKYDTNGNEVWVIGYNGPANYYDVACCIKVDGSGNVYV